MTTPRAARRHPSTYTADARARNPIFDAEARILEILARATQGRAAGSPATVQYLGVYMSADGWKGLWSDVTFALRKLEQGGHVVRVPGSGFGTDAQYALAIG
jgi:aspartate/methionine/tyrosine aminotransferase